MKRLALAAAVLAVVACKSDKDAATVDTTTPAAAAPAVTPVDTTVKPDSAAVAGASTGATTAAKPDSAKH